MKSCPRTSNIPPRLNLAMYAAYAKPKVIDGKSLSPASVSHPETGKTSRLIPNTNTKIGPIKKVGTQIPSIAIAIGK